MTEEDRASGNVYLHKGGEFMMTRSNIKGNVGFYNVLQSTWMASSNMGLSCPQTTISSGGR